MRRGFLWHDVILFYGSKLCRYYVLSTYCHGVTIILQTFGLTSSYFADHGHVVIMFLQMIIKVEDVNMDSKLNFEEFKAGYHEFFADKVSKHTSVT